MIQRGLFAAVSLVLALVVIISFRGLLAPPGETLPRRTTTTEAAQPIDPEVTTTTVAATVTTTTAGVTTPAICIDEEPATEAATILQVYYPCGDAGLAVGGTYVYRAVPVTDLVLTTTMREMTKGLEPEEEALGFRSPFPDDAEGSFLGVSLAEGIAYIEFSQGIFPEGVDTPEGAQMFLSTLNANVFQFSSIDAVEYRISGSCAGFWQNLGSDCEVITRGQWEAQNAP